MKLEFAATGHAEYNITFKRLKEYFKVVLYDDDCFEVDDIIGRFETIEEAQFEARRYADEVFDGKGVRINIHKYRYDEVHTKYKWDVGAEYTF